MKKLIYLVLVWLIVALSSVSAQDSTPNEVPVSVMFAFDFEDGQLPPELRLTEHWRLEQIAVDDGGEATVLVGIVGVGGGGLIFLPSPRWENTSLEMRMRLAGTGEMSINTRRDTNQSDCDSGFFFATSVLNNYTRLGVVDNACNAEWLDRGDDVNFPMGEWINFRMDTIDNGAFVYVNDQLILTGAADVSPVGATALNIRSDMKLEIDSITVSKIGGAAIQIAQYDGSPLDIVTELQSNNMIPLEGGSQVFLEPYVFYTGIGSGFVPLAFRQTFTDTVMGAELEFNARAEDSPELCAMATRVSVAERSLTGLLRVDVVSTGEFRVIDQAPDMEPSGAALPLPLDLSQRHKILVVTIGDSISAYIDGRLVLDNFPVVSREGFFALVYFGARSSSICEMRNFWVYEFDGG